MTIPWAVQIVAVLLTAGFLFVVVYADDSEGSNEGFEVEWDGTDLKVTGHGVLLWDSAWNGLKTLTIVPEGGEVSIGYAAFISNLTLETVTIQGSVGPIGDHAFRSCNALKTVTLEGSVGSIGVHAFEGCSVLATVTIQGSVGSIGDSAFDFCDALKTVTINGSVGSIGERAFTGSDTLETVTIEGSVGPIGDHAFESCGKLETLTITGPITSIETNAFSGCSNLKTVNIACNDPLNITVYSANNGHIAYHADTVNHVHRYSAVYGWADDGKSCTVHIVCANTADHNHDVNADITSTVKIPPTETTMGTTEYSVSGTYDGFAYSDTKGVQDIPCISGSDSGNNNDALIYIAAAGAIGAAVLIGAAFVIISSRR